MIYDIFKFIFTPINESESPFKAFKKISLGLIFVYLGYWGINHISNFTEILGNTYSSGGKVLNVLLYPVALIMICLGALSSCITIINIVKLLDAYIKAFPGRVRHEIQLLKQIWHNRGFGKYRPFGGLFFYFKLRQRVLAYLFACMAIGILAWYAGFKQQVYEKSNWKINFYQKEPLPYFTFKANVPYTIESNSDYYEVIINGIRYVMGERTHYKEDLPYKLQLSLPRIWNITFSDTTLIHFEFYREPINQIFSQALEVWEDKKMGITIYPNQFYHSSISGKHKSDKHKETKIKEKKVKKKK